MRTRDHRSKLWRALAILAGIFLLFAPGLFAQEKTGTEIEQLAAKDDHRPAGQVYKNVQILKEVPADQFVQTMKGFTKSLGVRCEFCHVTAPGSETPGFGAFSKDDVEQKRTARKMILMVRDMRTRYFDDKESPTCWTCHAGNKKPEFEPPNPAEPKK